MAISRQGGVVPGPGGCTWSGGVPGLGGVPGPGGVPGQVLPPPCGQTHSCKNITFATSLRTVIILDDLLDKSLYNKV